VRELMGISTVLGLRESSMFLLIAVMVRRGIGVSGEAMFDDLG